MFSMFKKAVGGNVEKQLVDHVGSKDEKQIEIEKEENVISRDIQILVSHPVVSEKDVLNDDESIPK